MREKPCSRCGEPRDRPNQRLCKACHRESMKRWREAHEYIAKPVRFHVKPFVNRSSVRDRLEIREADGLYQLLINGIPVDIGPPIECPFEAAAFLRAMQG